MSHTHYTTHDFLYLIKQSLDENTKQLKRIADFLERCERNPLEFKELEDISCMAVRKE